jgi:hypothetical protein
MYTYTLQPFLRDYLLTLQVLPLNDPKELPELLA